MEKKLKKLAMVATDDELESILRWLETLTQSPDKLSLVPLPLSRESFSLLRDILASSPDPGS